MTAVHVTIPLHYSYQLGGTISNVSVAMRYNGTLFPPPVVNAMRNLQSNNLTTGAYGLTTLTAMPDGYYEFWPLTDIRTREGAARGELGPAPAQLLARPGVNWVTLTFTSSP